MPTYKSPGVYVEEISTLPPSVAEVSTAVPAFIGATERGPKLARINTLLEYEEIFGGPPKQEFSVKLAGESVESVSRVVPDAAPSLTYYCISHYFKNGGGSCFVASVAGYDAPAGLDQLQAGLDQVEKEDEPTLLLMPDAIQLAKPGYYELCQQALKQCQKLGDRFALFDVEDTSNNEFRDNIGTEALSYGAAYHPYLETTLAYRYSEQDVTVDKGADKTTTLAELAAGNSELYNKIKVALSNERVTLPPSAAVAGVYASVDRDRGVWKAPANVSLNSVIGPVSKISHEQQEELNIDSVGGKSINAIRAFTGKGTLVWGARTLAGNDNEWRYISVRRLFNLIEESCRKATSFAVFEPNDMTTWLKVKGMIEGYLYTLWEKGAFAGSAPEAAYFVNVGLGKSMTPQDVLEGQMIVEIGVAAVRPAEFVVLRFSHKLQEA